MLLPFLIHVLAGALAADGSRCCLREWLARAPDPGSRLGRWHSLMFVLTLAVRAFTAAGYDSPEAIAQWAAGCAHSPESSAASTRRRSTRPCTATSPPFQPAPRTRFQWSLGTSASGAAPPGLAQAARDSKTVRGAVRGDGSQVDLLSVFDVITGTVRAQREVDAKTTATAPVPEN